MRIQTSLLGFVALVSVSSDATNAHVIEWRFEGGGNGHRYELVDAPLTWPDAKVAAEGMEFMGVSGHLVTLTSAEENEFVYNDVYDRLLYEHAWIGLTDDETYGGYESFGQSNPKVDGWVWVTEEPVEFTSWETVAPNNFGGNEDYARMHRYTQFGSPTPWDDGPSYATFPYIVEYDISPVDVQQPPGPSGFQLIDDFARYPVGSAIDGRGHWQAEAGEDAVAAGVLPDPLNPSNHVLSIGVGGFAVGRLGHRETINADPSLRIAEGKTATLFFQLTWDNEQVNLSAGMTDVANPISDVIFNSFDQFESQLRLGFASGYDELTVRNAGAFDVLDGDVHPLTRYDVWMVIDNDADSTEFFIQGSDFGTQTQLASDGTTRFAFRNGDAANDLVTFFIATGRNIGSLPPSPSEHVGPVYLDNIYIDTNGRNLSNPVAIPVLQAGDANQNLTFDQADIGMVALANKYHTGRPATWGEGDWNGAPGGNPGNPPPGDGVFDQKDIVAALAPGHYLSGPYAAIRDGGQPGDGQTSVGYSPTTGEVWVDAPAGTDLTSINIDSAAGIFTGGPAQNLGGSFDNHDANNIFKATFGSSFGSLSFGNVAQPGLSFDFILKDLTVVGSLAGGGGLGNVDCVCLPEPSTLVLLSMGMFIAGVRRRRVCNWSMAPP